ncbi:MAG: hypothetical protein Q8Q09_27890 [Deltaproteobacteria bacterium]|nr:hypothetical protein [Deltaproteobacteria bacterium]
MNDATPRWFVFTRAQTQFALSAHAVRCVLPSIRSTPYPTPLPLMLSLFAYDGRIVSLVDPQSDSSESITDVHVCHAVLVHSELGDVAFALDHTEGFANTLTTEQRLEPEAILRMLRWSIRRGERISAP